MKSSSFNFLSLRRFWFFCLTAFDAALLPLRLRITGFYKNSLKTKRTDETTVLIILA